MPIIVQHKNIQSIPSLIVTKTTKQKEALPTLIYYHGFTSAKEVNLPLAYLLAKKGYRIILPDSQEHGEREVVNSSVEKELLFWDIVIQNINEIPYIKQYLDEQNLILNGRIGIAGTSMGGITTASALTQYSWLKAAAILMGTPKTVDYAKKLIKNYSKTHPLPAQEEQDILIKTLSVYDMSQHMEKLNNRPILFWHGEQDDVVPYAHAKDFYEQAIPLYDKKENIYFLSESEQGHKVSRYAIMETIKWFEKYL